MFQRSMSRVLHERAWNGNTLLETVPIPKYKRRPSRISSSVLTKFSRQAIPITVKGRKSASWITSKLLVERFREEREEMRK